jgi:hypothetical protein
LNLELYLFSLKNVESRNENCIQIFSLIFLKISRSRPWQRRCLHEDVLNRYILSSIVRVCAPYFCYNGGRFLSSCELLKKDSVAWILVCLFVCLFVYLFVCLVSYMLSYCSEDGR